MVVFNRWVTLIAGMYMMMVSGTIYLFPDYSNVLKTSLGYSVEQTNLVGTMLNTGIPYSPSLLLSFSPSLLLSFSPSLILSFSHSLILSFSHSLILSFSHSLILPSPFSHSPTPFPLPLPLPYFSPHFPFFFTTVTSALLFPFTSIPS